MTLRNRTLVDTLIERALGTDTSPEAQPEPQSSEQPEESA
jgi:hypothetical protein